MKFLKNNKWIWLLLLLLLYSCSSGGGRYWRVRVEMPRPVSFELERFEEMVVTDFLVLKERTDFDLNKETTEYFTFEFGKNIQIPVSKAEVVFAEGTIQHQYDIQAIFQSKAWILREPQEDLVKFLDVPSTQVGDLFYIQNLVAALEAEFN